MALLNVHDYERSLSDRVQRNLHRFHMNCTRKFTWGDVLRMHQVRLVVWKRKQFGVRRGLTIDEAFDALRMIVKANEATAGRENDVLWSNGTTNEWSSGSF